MNRHRKYRGLGFLVLLTVGMMGCRENAPDISDSVTVILTKDPRKSIQLEYFPNGALKDVKILDADSVQSSWIAFGDSAGLVSWTGVFTGPGVEHFVEYYPNGRPIGLCNFDSSTTGHAVYYHSNGHKRSEGNWVNNRMVGIWFDYHEDGTIQRIDTLK